MNVMELFTKSLRLEKLSMRSSLVRDYRINCKFINVQKVRSNEPSRRSFKN